MKTSNRKQTNKKPNPAPRIPFICNATKECSVFKDLKVHNANFKASF